MKNFFKQWRENRRRMRFDSGYKWAATALLRGSETPDSIEAKAQSPFNDDKDPFDDGAMSAVDDWERRGQQEKQAPTEMFERVTTLEAAFLALNRRMDEWEKVDVEFAEIAAGLIREGEG